MHNLTTTDALADTLGIKTQAGKTALALALANVQLLDRKQQDYGSKNISNFGFFGVIVRMNDKFERLKNLTLEVKGGNVTLKQGDCKNESVDDTLDDICNYAIIARMTRNNTWPNE